MQQLEIKFEKNPQLKDKFLLERGRFKQTLKQSANMRKVNPGNNLRTTATIPVVFHIVSTNPNEVTDAQIQAQIDTLNKDFAGTNGDAAKIPSYFKPLFGSSGIQFCLAKQSPDGEFTNGIERVITTEQSFSAYNELIKHASTGGATAWDPSKYYNVWLCTMSGGTLGYATFPDMGNPDEQGVVIDFHTLPGGSFDNYNSGKTLTHETGHYFNLYHIWGDDEEDRDNGTCSGSDDVDDTPNQSVHTDNCLTGIKTDSCTPSGNGIMYQNFMDYTYDDCLLMFTKDQVTRMENALLQYRSSLMSSNGCSPGITRNYDAQIAAITAPLARICNSPFNATISLRNKGVQTLTSLVISARIDNGAIFNYNWTGSLAFLATASINLANIPTDTGSHTLTIYVSNPNNNKDEFKGNDSLSTHYQYYNAVTSLSEGFESNTFPPRGWDLISFSNKGSWELTKNVSKSGTSSIMINNFNNEVLGTKSDFRLRTINIAKQDSAFLSFQVAYATYSDFNTPGNNWDTLEVLVSTDCGITYSSVYKKWGSTLATRQTPTENAFVPTASEWRKDSVDLTNYAGQTNLLVAFRNTNGYENNLYIDDINLRTAALVNPNLKRLGFMVTPNPTNGVIAAQFYPVPTNLLGIDIFDAMGRKLKEVAVKNGLASSSYSFDISGYSAGTYYIRAIYTDRILTRKILKY